MEARSYPMLVVVLMELLLGVATRFTDYSSSRPCLNVTFHTSVTHVSQQGPS
jgi:hypothetical protein